MFVHLVRIIYTNITWEVVSSFLQIIFRTVSTKFLHVDVVVLLINLSYLTYITRGELSFYYVVYGYLILQLTSIFCLYYRREELG